MGGHIFEDAGLAAEAASPFSLPGSYRTVPVTSDPSWWRRFFCFAGPGCLIAVGYMDPGNWATDIAGGSAFGYTLLAVILTSSLMAIVLQVLAARLGLAGGRDLAQACRERYPRPVWLGLWSLAKVGIVATDLAEVIGTAIALQLLFDIPLLWGVCLTALDVLLILYLQHRGFRYLEALILTLVVITAACFTFQLALSAPPIAAVARGFVPDSEIIANPAMLYIAMGIVGATVMPHNLYLHSSIVQTRRHVRSAEGTREAIKFATVDTIAALLVAFCLNAAILVLAASTFHAAGHTEVAGIEEAHALLAPLLGAPLAALAFGIALLATGQSSTITATLAGQIVMEGFLRVRLPNWARRLITRALAIVPAVLIVAYYGPGGASGLLVFSQVILSLQLPFAVVPLVQFTSQRKVMGQFESPSWLRVLAISIAAILIALNAKLVSDAFLAFGV